MPQWKEYGKSEYYNLLKIYGLNSEVVDENQEEDPNNQAKLAKLKRLGLFGKLYTYDLTFPIDWDWASSNGPDEVEEEITNSINGIGSWEGVGKLINIDVSGQVGGFSDWDSPLNSIPAEEDDDEIDIYDFTGEAYIRFTSYLPESSIEDFINDHLIQITDGNYELEIIDEN
jgi:hypothetical protein